MLVDYMNHIYEDEDDINFEEYLSEKDFEILKQRKLGKLDGKHAEEIMAFPPSYSIRPTGFQVIFSYHVKPYSNINFKVEEKLREQYNLELLHKSEPKPVELETPSDFLMVIMIKHLVFFSYFLFSPHQFALCLLLVYPSSARTTMVDMKGLRIINQMIPFQADQHSID